MRNDIFPKGASLPIKIISFQPFHDRGRYHIETSPLICSANQWIGFYMITASVLKGLMKPKRLGFFAEITNPKSILAICTKMTRHGKTYSYSALFS